MVTVSILGAGNRGTRVYGTMMKELSNKFKIVALCDINEEMLNYSASQFEVKKENLFLLEDEFFKEKRSDLLVIATLDKDHVRQAKKAITLGYHILLEKPISASAEECLELAEFAKNYNKVIMVCHVLRYTVAIEKLKELLDSKIIGDLVLIDHIEQVAYWHQCHSYVRGNWHNTKETAPMIMAKSCHDMDLLQYFANSKCKNVSSLGNLQFFNKYNKPEGSSDRCLECKFQNDCAFSAKKLYVDEFDLHKEKPLWTVRTLVAGDVTRENLIDALNKTNYGKCVFDCDNDAVDNQAVLMEFENGIKATFRMTAFTQNGGRQIHFHGTLGEIFYNETENIITLNIFGKPEEIIDITKLTNDFSGHGGGDKRMINYMYELIVNPKLLNDGTSLINSIESHLMCCAIEESRLNNGKMVQVHSTNKNM